MSKTTDFLTQLTNFNVSSLTNEPPKVTNSETIDESAALYYKPGDYMRELNLSTYNSLIRFIPYYKNPEKSILSKYVSWIKNNKTGKMRKIDDTPFLNRKPRIIGKCFFACHNETGSALFDLKNRFNSNEEHTCLIQVIDDPQKPELNGKIMIYQFKKTLHNKLREARFPKIKQVEAHNPFVLEAKGFAINLYYKITDNGLNKFVCYENCSFIDKKFKIVDEDGKNIDDEKKIQKLITEEKLINEFEKNEFKEWDNNTKKFVAESIVSIFPDCAALQKIKNEYPEIFLLLEDENESTNNENTVSNVKQEESFENIVNDTQKIKETKNDDDVMNLDDFNFLDDIDKDF